MLDRPTTRDGWLARAAALKIEGRAFIDGAYVAAADGTTFAKVSPIDGKAFAKVADCGAADIDRAVHSARKAFESGVWRDADPAKKKKVLLRFAELIREHTEELALLETLDVGKPIANALNVDVPFCANCIQYYAEFADKLSDEVAPVGANDVALVRKEPLGVIGAIVPWNYPLIIAAWKLGPALVAGNSVILKPAEQSPLGALMLGRLGKEAGLPDGVLNVVPGFGEKAGKPLALHPDVDMIAFTGSTEVGKLMLVYAGQSNMKRVALECGGRCAPPARRRQLQQGDRRGAGHLRRHRQIPRQQHPAQAAGRQPRRGRVAVPAAARHARSLKATLYAVTFALLLALVSVACMCVAIIGMVTGRPATGRAGRCAWPPWSASPARSRALNVAAH